MLGPEFFLSTVAIRTSREKHRKMLQLIELPPRATTSLSSACPVSVDFCKIWPNLLIERARDIWPSNTPPCNLNNSGLPNLTPYPMPSLHSGIGLLTPLLQARHGFDRCEVLPSGEAHRLFHPSTSLQTSNSNWMVPICQHKNHHWCWTKNLPLDFHHAGLDRTGLSDITTAYRWNLILIVQTAGKVDNQMQSMQWQVEPDQFL